MNDMLFIGTDPHGLILKLDRKSGKVNVVFDAPESEVSTLLLDTRNGHLFAATSQLVEASEEEAGETSGHPADAEAGEPLDMDPVQAPAPKPPEDGLPGELQTDHKAPDADVRTDAAAGTSTDAATASPPAAPATNKAAPAEHGPSPAGPITQIGGTDPASNGNAIYRIDSQGFVSEIFRDPSMVLAMARQEDQLLIATGPTGALYQLDVASEEHTAIAKLRSQMLTSILITSDKSVYVGSAMTATLSRLSAGLATTGTLTSPVLDASQVSAFGKAQIRGAVSEGAAITIATRSSNVDDDESDMWTDWCAPVPAARFTTIQTPPGRYLQYRVTMSGTGVNTPVLDSVAIAYQQPNVAPRIDSIAVTVEPTEDGSPQSMRTIGWVVTEPNGDELRYAVYQRNNPASPWIQLAKDLAEVTWQWDTRKVSDGRYEVKVDASDALANASGTGKTVSRIAEAIRIDNTPPAIGDIKISREGGNVTISLRVADRGGLISGLEYALDPDGHWQTVPPSDMLNDSPDEQYTVVLPDSGVAVRLISLRSRDESGNTAYESVTIRPDTK